MDDTRKEVVRGSLGYPRELEDLPNPPETLYVRGDGGALTGNCLGVIGARQATPYGLAVAEMAGRIAAECGITVVSGGAMGCDAAALRGAQRAGGATIVVTGTGADRVYPSSSRDVFEHAARTCGCVIAIEPWGTPPMRHTFPKRNRIIAALSRALLVAEAGEPSGTSSTAECAAGLGRLIYAIPGSIFSPQSLGANRLIASGAAIIASEEELEAQISLDFGALRLLTQGSQRKAGRVLSALTASPMRPDDLANHLGLSVLEMIRILSDYEASGVVSRLPDGRYSPSQDYFAGRVVANETHEGQL